MKAKLIGFLKSDKLNSLGGSAVLSLGRLGATVAMARIASPEDFARFILLVSASVIFLNIPMSSILTPMVNRAGGLDAGGRRAMMEWTHLRLLRFLGIGGVVALPGVWLAPMGGLSLAVYLGFIATVLSGGELLYQRSRLQVLFRMSRAFWADVLGLSGMVLGVVLAVFLDLSVLACFWWGSFAGQGLAIAMMQLGAGESVSKTKLSGSVLEKVRKEGYYMLGGSLANSAGARLQPFILAGVGTALTVAQFGMAWTLVGPIRMLSGGLSSVLRPRLAVFHGQGDVIRFQRMLISVQSLIGAAGLGATVVGVFWGSEIAGLVFGNGLQGVGRLVPLALLYGTVDALTTSQMIALQIKVPNGAGRASRFRLEAAIVSLLLLVPACYFGGAWGAFCGLLAAELGYALRAGLALRKDAKRTTALMGEASLPA